MTLNSQAGETDLRTEPRHSLPFGDTVWRVWRDVLIRSAGFPVAPVMELSDHTLAALVDAQADDDSTVVSNRLSDALACAIDRQSDLLRRQAESPLFREALAWQNPQLMVAVKRICANGQRNSKFRKAERVLMRYWQRYATKNETIGFFGPMAWGGIVESGPALTFIPDATLLARRWTLLEDWAVRAVAHVIASDPMVSEHVPLWRSTHVHVGKDGGLTVGNVRQGALDPSALAVLQAARGQSTVSLIDELLTDGSFTTSADAGLTIERLVVKGQIFKGFDIRPVLDAAERLSAQIAELPTAPRTQALSIWEPILAARSAVEAAAGDVTALLAAEQKLQELFGATVGQEGSRHPGKMYAGRRLCFEDTSRGVKFTVSPDLLRPHERALDIVLRAAHWTCAEVGRVVEERLNELFDDLADSSADVTLADLGFMAQALLLGLEPVVVRVSDELVHRWDRLLGIVNLDPSTTEIVVDSNEIYDRIDEYFPDVGVYNTASLLHSPDIQFVADSISDICQGNSTAVLGELHAGWPAFVTSCFAFSHPDPATITAGMWHDSGAPRPRLLFPSTWPRLTGRLMPALGHHEDTFISFAPAPTWGVSEPNLVRATDALVTREDGHLVVSHGDRRWPLLEVYSDQLAMVHTVDAFKTMTARPHTPRVTLDSLIVHRQTWRTTCEETGLCKVMGVANRYIAARRWRSRLGLPERIFVKLSSETKPFFVDLTSTLLVDMFVGMVRAAGLVDMSTLITISEMMPDLDRAWLPDADGQRYVSEFRMQFVRSTGVVR